MRFNGQVQVLITLFFLLYRGTQLSNVPIAIKPRAMQVLRPTVSHVISRIFLPQKILTTVHLSSQPTARIVTRLLRAGNLQPLIIQVSRLLLVTQRQPALTATKEETIQLHRLIVTHVIRQIT